MALSNEEYEALRQLTILRQKGVFKRVIVLLNCASPLQLDFLNDESVQVDALMWVGNTGMSGVNAVAKALVGKINPSGRLSDTYVYDNFSSPAMTNWMLSDNGAFALSWNDSRFDENLKAVQQYYGQYVEGIYVGYRYYETRYADMVEGMANVGLYDYAQTVAYPFGYGLSYTEFDYSAMSVIKNTDGKGYTVEVTVTNVGENAGKEVVQVYLSKPYTDYAKKHHIEVSSVELVGFAKTDVLQPDQSVTVTINIDKADFASYDVYGAGTYIIDAGQYLLTVAKDAHEANNNVLAYKDFGVRNGMTADGNASLVKLAEDVATIDKTTYAVSTETGAEVSNKLASGDINRYSGAEDNSVTYVSRSNWQDTFPTEKAEIRLTDRMFEDLQVVDIADVKSVGEMPNFGENNGLTLVMMRGKGIDDPDWDKLLSQMSFDELDTLLTTCISQTPYVASVTKPQTKEMDGPTYCKEGVTDSRFPCEGIWASTFNTALVEEVGEALANDARLAGYSGMWIPGINIHRTPYGGRNHEYFSEDPVLTGVMAEAEIKSLQRYGVIAQPKHYAFNEQEIFRGGIGVWLDEQTAREIYLKPWKYAVSPDRGNAHALMTSFNRFGTKWTSADINLVSILRDEFGFEGYIITDMADAVGTQYMVALDGILAGTDCWLSSGSHSFAAYKNNATVVTAMRNAAKRMMYNVTNYSCAMNGISNTMRIVKIATWWEITLTTLIVVFAVLSAASITLLVLSEVKRNKKD